jgi:adenine-specific DNA-methyltransferase
MKEESEWKKARERYIRIHDILQFIKLEYGKEYAENSRETIRRQTLHQFVQAGLVLLNGDDQSRPTNSPNTVYSITPECLNLLRKFGTPRWSLALRTYIKRKGKLVEKYQKRKMKYYKKIHLPKGPKLVFSPGKHNTLQIEILTNFRASFCPNAMVVYVGDAARKLLYVNSKIAKKISIPITKHNKLPDIVLYEVGKNRLFLIEVVTAHGPVSPKRQLELESTLVNSQTKRVYVTAFPNFIEFKKHITNIAWETEVWISEIPDHLIHFNGDKFLKLG